MPKTRVDIGPIGWGAGAELGDHDELSEATEVYDVADVAVSRRPRGQVCQDDGKSRVWFRDFPLDK